MNVRNLLLSFLLGAAMAGIVTWILVRDAARAANASGAHDGTADVLRAETRAGAGGPTLVGSPEALARLEAIEAQNGMLEQEIQDLQARIAELQPPPSDPDAFRFGLPASAPAFDQADWPKLSGHASRLTKLLAGLREALAGGSEFTGKQRADLQAENLPLAEFAVSFGADIDDATPNGAYTHPAVVANLIRAALSEAEDPLSQDQEIAIQTLGDAWVREQQRAQAETPAAVPALGRRVQDVDAKLRFLASVKSNLSSSQQAILFHPEMEGRLHLDLLSPVLVYALTVAVDAKDRAEMETKLLTSLFQTAGIEGEDVTAGYEWVARQWVDEIPGVLTPLVPRSPDHVFPHVNQVQAKARAQVAATERILAMGRLTEEDEVKLRAIVALVYPLILAQG